MGLDIGIHASPARVLDDERGVLDQKAVANVKRICASLRLAQDDPISVRPGSYAGVHRVRCIFAKHKGWTIHTEGHVAMGKDSPANESHLINHSDCEGYYLPDDFDKPAWLYAGSLVSVSVGSSVRLLAELREIEDLPKDESQQWAWDALYIAAIASVACYEVIEFG